MVTQEGSHTSDFYPTTVGATWCVSAPNLACLLASLFFSLERLASGTTCRKGRRVLLSHVLPTLLPSALLRIIPALAHSAAPRSDARPAICGKDEGGFSVHMRAGKMRSSIVIVMMVAPLHEQKPMEKVLLYSIFCDSKAAKKDASPGHKNEPIPLFPLPSPHHTTERQPSVIVCSVHRLIVGDFASPATTATIHFNHVIRRIRRSLGPASAAFVPYRSSLIGRRQ